MVARSLGFLSIFLVACAAPVASTDGTAAADAGDVAAALATDVAADAPAPDVAPDAAVDAAADGVAAPDVAVGDPCGAGVAAGTTTIAIPYGGINREYILHVPPEHSGHLPLVVNFHGLTMTDAGEEVFSAMDAKADAAHFIVAYPNGLNESFNAGLCCGTSGTAQVDDVGFTRALVADIQKRVCVDAKRIYATGMSNGGFMSQRLGCDAADLFAAIAPVSGLLAVVACNPSRPMPVIEFHGTADSIVQYGGVPSVDATWKGWAQRDGCTDTPIETFHKGTASCMTYSQCNGGVKVTQCTLAGEGHCWPGQALCPYGAADMDLNADDAIGEFLQAFSLP